MTRHQPATFRDGLGLTTPEKQAQFEAEMKTEFVLNVVNGYRDLVTVLAEVIQQLKRGECWCEVGIGNPMMRGTHSTACVNARAAMDEIEKMKAMRTGDDDEPRR